MQKSLLVEQAFRIWSVIEDYSPLRGSPCGPLLAQRSLASLESNLPAPGGSHPHELQMQKSLLVEQAFRIWSVIEDYSPLRGSPCGPLLAQRSLASLESNLPTRHFVARPAGRCWRNVLSLRSSRTSPPPEVLILMGFKCKKACSLSRLFEFGR